MLEYPPALGTVISSLPLTLSVERSARNAISRASEPLETPMQ